MLKKSFEDVSPAILHLNSFYNLFNTSTPSNHLLIIEITGDFSKVKMQVITFLLWSIGEAPVMPLMPHRPLLATPPSCTLCVGFPAVKHLAFRTSHGPRPQPRNKQSHSSLWLLRNLSVSNISE